MSLAALTAVDLERIPVSTIEPGRRSKLVDTSDDNPLPFIARAFQFAEDTDCHYTTVYGDEETVPAGFFKAGVQYSGMLTKIFVTGTTARQVLIWG